jgi:metallo-beta-lactamase family protein
MRQLDVYSGHADANGLMRWIQARAPISGSIFLNHGEPENAAALNKRLRAAKTNTDVLTPQLDQAFSLAAGVAASALPFSPRLEQGRVESLDWHNAKAELLSDLEEKLNAAADDASRERLLADMAAKLREK